MVFSLSRRRLQRSYHLVDRRTFVSTAGQDFFAAGGTADHGRFSLYCARKSAPYAHDEALPEMIV
jgi:hypothetical protein